MTLKEVENEILKQIKMLHNIPNAILEVLYINLPFIIKLNIKKIYLDYNKNDKYIIIWMNLYNNILVSIDVSDDPSVVSFSISYKGEVLVISTLPISELTDKLQSIQKRLK